MQTKDYLKRLLFNYINGKISGSEREELFMSLDSGEQSEEWKTLIRELSSELSITGNYDEEEWEPVIQEILLESGAKPLPVHRVSLWQRNWFRYAAAVVLLMGMAGIWNTLYNTKAPEKQEMVAKPDKQQVFPGSNKAVLSLSDGSAMVLDSSANGLISDQGNIRVIKLEDGKLAYDVSSGKKISEPLYNTITTPRGGQYQVILPDGTGVWLNCASSIMFPAVFNKKERVVKITGEVYFEVKHMGPGKIGEGTPFIVEAADTRITVLGTHFNINAYSDEGPIRTTLVEGSVKVTNGNNTTMIKAGEQVLLNKLENKYTILRPSLDGVLAWKNGKFVFRNSSILSIVRQISRWYDVDVYCRGELSDIIFSGSISRKTEITKLIELLEMDSRVKFEVNGRELTISPK